VECRFQPTKLHLKTLVEDRYKLTLYADGDAGELFDLETDPGERQNLWNDPAARELKFRLIRRMLNAQMNAEPMPMPRISVA
jgi:uncharacterized sulfatase